MTIPVRPSDLPGRARRRAFVRIAALIAAIAMARVVAEAAPHRLCGGVWTRVDTVENCGACGLRCGADHAAASCAEGRCVLVCEADHADCDSYPGNGCEVDLLTDRTHCGVCTRSCGGALCAEGACVARLIGTGAAIAADDTAVYALGQGVWKYPLDGGDAAVIAPGDGFPGEAHLLPFSLELREGSLRWVIPPRRKVFAVPKGGGAVIEKDAEDADAPLFRTATAPLEMVDGSQIYRVEALPDGGAAVTRSARSGGAAAVVVTHPTSIRALSQNARHVFWIDGKLRIFMAPKRPR